MKVPNNNNKVIASMAWLTDEEFGHDHWRAAQFSCGRGTDPAIILRFDSREERDRALKALRELYE